MPPPSLRNYTVLRLHPEYTPYTLWPFCEGSLWRLNPSSVSLFSSPFWFVSLRVRSFSLFDLLSILFFGGTGISIFFSFLLNCFDFSPANPFFTLAPPHHHLPSNPGVLPQCFCAGGRGSSSHPPGSEPPVKVTRGANRTPFFLSLLYLSWGRYF